LSRDPIGERGGANLYGFLQNIPSQLVDLMGLGAATYAIKNWNKAYKNLQDAKAKLEEVQKDVTKYADTLLGEQIGEVAQVAWEDYMDAIAAEQEAYQEMAEALGLADVSWECFRICVGATPEQLKGEFGVKGAVGFLSYVGGKMSGAAFAAKLAALGLTVNAARVAFCYCYCYIM
jgi:hypothetical protein